MIRQRLDGIDRRRPRSRDLPNGEAVDRGARRRGRRDVAPPFTDGAYQTSTPPSPTALLASEPVIAENALVPPAALSFTLVIVAPGAVWMPTTSRSPAFVDVSMTASDAAPPLPASIDWTSTSRHAGNVDGQGHPHPLRRDRAEHPGEPRPTSTSCTPCRRHRSGHLDRCRRAAHTTPSGMVGA